MSLISDALKKARQEAARQDSLRQGVPYAVGSVESPSRRGLLPVLAGLGAGCLVAGLLFAIAWAAGWGPFARPQAALAPQVAVAQQAAPLPPALAPAATPPQSVEVHEETPSPKPVQTQPATPPPPAAQTHPAPESTPPAAPPKVEPAAPQPAQPSIVVQPSAPPVEEPPAATVPAAPAPSPAPAPQSSGGLEEGKVYAGEVPVPGGGSIKLNGIAFSPEHPIVVLDGRVMGPGETVQGFTVVEIQSDRVKLQGHGTTVFVTTK